MNIAYFDQTQIVSLAGAILVLSAFIGSNFKWMNPDGFVYAFFNCVGTGLLAYAVWKPFNLGLFAVEAVWCVTSLWLCIRVLRRRA